MKEKHVLASTIQSREAFNAIERHVGHNDLSEQGWIVWQGVRDYYENDGGCQRIDTELLSEAVARTVSADKHKDMFRNLCTSLGTFECSPANIVTDFLAQRREVTGQELANILLTGGDATALINEYTDLQLADALDEGDDGPEVRVGLSVEELCEVGFDQENLIEIWPPTLNARLDGGCKPGHHIILFARPEMGKTMAVIEMIAGFLQQGLTTLYVGNEDPMDDVNMRVINRLSGMNKFDVMNSPNKADARAREKNYELLIMAALTPGTPREITSLIETHRPEVLVLDQLRNLNMSQDNYVLALEQAAKQARQWAKRYSCVVVSVTQAGDSAEGKAILDMGDVDYSNTGIPSQADLMIGLGANKKNQSRGEIVISMPKNKISGKHEYFAVLTDPQLSQLIPLD